MTRREKIEELKGKIETQADCVVRLSMKCKPTDADYVRASNKLKAFVATMLALEAEVSDE